MTYQEALTNVEIIIKEWIETAKELGRHIPEPRGVWFSHDLCNVRFPPTSKIDDLV